MITKPGTYRTELYDETKDPTDLAYIVGETPFGDWAGVIGYQLPETWDDDGKPVRFTEHRITGEYIASPVAVP